MGNYLYIDGRICGLVGKNGGIIEILGWDKGTGAEVELSDDLKASVWASEEQLKISFCTKYQFQFEKRLKEFSVKELVEWVIKKTS